MKPEHMVWIKENVKTYEEAYGKCCAVSKKMVAAFPELRTARGFFYSVAWGRRAHWWCVAPDGSIVDPTVTQFPDARGELIPRGVIASDYEELVGTDKDIADRAPTGRCMDCGSDVYHGDTFCNKDCEAATLAYLEDPRSAAEKDYD